MRVFYDYPLATEENMKAVQAAIESGADVDTIFGMFDEELLWDCYIVMSGQDDTAWQVFDWQNGNEQYRIEDWQQEGLESYYQELAEDIARNNLLQ